MYLPAPTESDFKPVPDGTHLGICYRVIDLGTQSTTFNGEAKQAHKVLLTWELPQELMDDGRPYMISQSYTWSMHEKATLRKSLEAWRGMAFTERDFGPNGFDIKNVLGKACTLSVVHTSKNGNTYANISSIGKVMKGIAVPERVNPLVYLWLVPERWDAKVFSELSANLQAKIMASPQYIEMMNASNVGGNHDNHHTDNMSDDIPF
jgi:hypothetical protein